MDCILCKDKGYVMIKGYQTDKMFKVGCPYCAESEQHEEKTGSGKLQSALNCGWCNGSGKITIEGQDKTARIVTCGHCKGSGYEPDSEQEHSGKAGAG